jgi:hypothetical protein
MKIRPLGAELFHAHGKMDRHEVDFRNFAKAPKNLQNRIKVHMTGIKNHESH